MSDSDKTKKELIAELEALRSKLHGKRPEDPAPESAGAEAAGISRRDLLASAWVAPVILTVPLGVGSVVSQRAHAQTSVPTTPAPTNVPTTPAPTNVPATPAPAPTAFPTAASGVIPVEISDFDIS